MLHRRLILALPLAALLPVPARADATSVISGSSRLLERFKSHESWEGVWNLLGASQAVLLAPAITSGMGIEVVDMPYAELNAAWQAADKDQAGEIAARWQKTARKIENVSRETLQKSAAMYLAQKDVLKNHGANAITINCLGGFYGGHIHAYPCLGFHELNNEGLIGGCECDLRSAATMVAMTETGQRTVGIRVGLLGCLAVVAATGASAQDLRRHRCRQVLTAAAGRSRSSAESAAPTRIVLEKIHGRPGGT